MKTQIFKTKLEFYARTDRELNGVSEEFAKLNPNYEKDNENNKGCWNCSRCSRCSDCSDCSRCSGCSDCYDCYGCYGCSGCSDCYGCSGCSRCSRCSDCSDCSRCSDCSDCYGEKVTNKESEIPIIKDIHQKLCEVTSKDKALDMSQWHTCDTTHCRAGWIVTLAGDKGKELENKTSTLFAAMQIYHKSSDIKVSPVRFFDNDADAMKDIKKCAELERGK